MTTALTFLAGALLGGAVVAVVAVWLHLRWAEATDYRQLRRADARTLEVDGLLVEHFQRRARRAAGRLDEVMTEARE